jgi:hypothetical protein
VKGTFNGETKMIDFDTMVLVIVACVVLAACATTLKI